MAKEQRRRPARGTLLTLGSAALEKYDRVRVKHVSERACSNAWAVNQRQPEVGDSGAVVEVLCEHGRPQSYVVECVGESGSTVWLEEFSAGEIERIRAND